MFLRNVGTYYTPSCTVIIYRIICYKQKRHEFRGAGGVTKHKMCILFPLQLLSETFPIL
jgi:hypothetical protein